LAHSREKRFEVGRRELGDPGSPPRGTIEIRTRKLIGVFQVSDQRRKSLFHTLALRQKQNRDAAV
jgi:hypothetical protein